MGGFGEFVGNIFTGNEAGWNDRATGWNQMKGYTQYAENQLTDYYNKAQGYLDPYQNTGQSSLPFLQYMATGGTSGTKFDVTQDPYYQFQMQQGQKAIDQFMASRGGYNSSFAGTQYNNLAQEIAGKQTERDMNLMLQMAGMGQSAAGQQSNNALATGSEISSLYQNLLNQRDKTSYGEHLFSLAQSIL